MKTLAATSLLVRYLTGDALIWVGALASRVTRVYTLHARFPREEVQVGPPEDPSSG
ncbi:hypothetical protein [Thermus islandicus]|uniref:hypothetical protein n=1 Tax=Thermus islandicus TaxID=540988 RepID=UPI0003B5BFB3|nr:hypothetical protein [Thermus islandicus]